MNWQQRHSVYHQRFPGHSGIHVGQPSRLMCVGMVRSFPGTLCPGHWSRNKLTMKIEDKEASIGEITVEFEQDLVGGAVCCLEGGVSTEDSKLRWILVRTIPGKEIGYQRKKFKVIAETVQPAPQYGQGERTGMVWKVQCPLSVTNNNIWSAHGGHFLMSNIYKLVLQLN